HSKARNTPFDGWQLTGRPVATIIGSTNATASHHLRMLRNMGLAEYRKKGKMVFYRLVSNHVHHLMQEALQLKEKK
ncbi:MAG: ArsR family transcriptional regulator, partial [Staphylococcus hominis]